VAECKAMIDRSHALSLARQAEELDQPGQSLLPTTAGFSG
jgi:hypothetical protein